MDNKKNNSVNCKKEPLHWILLFVFKDLVKLQPQDSDDQESVQSEESIEPPPPENPLVTWTIYFLYFLLWATLYALALRLEFGAVYFILSSFYLIWANTRSGPKKEGEMSAYSVFNPDCQSIDGTLKAEQFEREIMFGAASLHWLNSLINN